MRVHVIGAGLAGLAASLALADAGLPVTLYEAGPAAGGRCRSYFDRQSPARSVIWRSTSQAQAVATRP